MARALGVFSVLRSLIRDGKQMRGPPENPIVTSEALQDGLCAISRATGPVRHRSGAHGSPRGAARIGIVNFHGSRRQHDRPPNEAEHVSHRSFANREFEIDFPTCSPASSIAMDSGSSIGSEILRPPF